MRLLLISKWIPALKNSSISRGISNRFELYPERSALSINCFISLAISLNAGASFTISSVNPCMSVDPFGIGICGFTILRFTCLVPSGEIFTIAISMILSIERLIPVVSRSIKAKGRVNCKVIRLYVLSFKF